MRLLIVDDSLVVRDAIQRSVDNGTITHVLRAGDGEEAVSIFARERPELVTMDLTLPRLNGLEAIRRIRETEPRTSILVISALNSHRTAMEALALGACGFLTKPFTAREISEALDQLAQHAASQSQW
ncbi:MAG TPA: response regulator [Thermoanaerobaculia bacterium]|jgi:two-component system chemotaxis response regulator CheY|nr:response regulator [Thermoanaerobaculia bacterium]